MDIWSFGCLLLELLTLQVPYCGVPETEIHNLLQVACLLYIYIRISQFKAKSHFWTQSIRVFSPSGYTLAINQNGSNKDNTIPNIDSVSVTLATNNSSAVEREIYREV